MRTQISLEDDLIGIEETKHLGDRQMSFVKCEGCRKDSSAAKAVGIGDFWSLFIR